MIGGMAVLNTKAGNFDLAVIPHGEVGAACHPLPFLQRPT